MGQRPSLLAKYNCHKKNLKQPPLVLAHVDFVNRLQNKLVGLGLYYFTVINWWGRTTHYSDKLVGGMLQSEEIKIVKNLHLSCQFSKDECSLLQSENSHPTCSSYHSHDNL